jgi:hypothetical protein
MCFELWHKSSVQHLRNWQVAIGYTSIGLN